MTDRIKKYREVEALSYSKLSKLASNPKNLIAEEKEESAALSFGSLVDCIMFTPEDFDETFYQTSVKKPGGEMQKWLDVYLEYELPTDYSLNDTDQIILKSRTISGYNKSLKDDTALRKFHDECDLFLGEMSKAGDRIIITDDDFSRAISMQSKLLNNEFTSPYFASELELVNQHEIYFDLEGTSFKGLLDGIIIDHENKTIKPYDLKTTSESLQFFEGEFIKWKYYLQAGLYRAGLSLMYPDYKILEFDFIVINDWEEPMIWRVDDVLHSLCMLGGTLRSGKQIKGVYQLIEDYGWHEKEKKYDYPADFYRNGGYKVINIL
jgi:hypothetical protein